MRGVLQGERVGCPGRRRSCHRVRRGTAGVEIAAGGTAGGEGIAWRALSGSAGFGAVAWGAGGAEEERRVGRGARASGGGEFAGLERGAVVGRLHHAAIGH